MCKWSVPEGMFTELLDLPGLNKMDYYGIDLAKPL